MKTISFHNDNEHDLVPLDKIVVVNAKNNRKGHRIRVTLVGGLYLELGFETETAMELEYFRIMKAIEGCEE